MTLPSCLKQAIKLCISDLGQASPGQPDLNTIQHLLCLWPFLSLNLSSTMELQLDTEEWTSHIENHPIMTPVLFHLRPIFESATDSKFETCPEIHYDDEVRDYMRALPFKIMNLRLKLKSLAMQLLKHVQEQLNIEVIADGLSTVKLCLQDKEGDEPK